MASQSSTQIRRALHLAQTGAALEPGSAGIVQLRTECSACNLRELCAPCCGLNQSERNVAKRLVFKRMRLRRGESLYRTGDHFTSIYAVRKGFFKSVLLLENGHRAQVIGFSMQGEVLGLDGIGAGQHNCNAIAVEESEICAIPFAGLQLLAHEIPSLQRHVRRMMSREIVREQGVMLLLGNMNAEERLAVFLLNLSRRYAAQGYSPSEFDVRMTRDEIGSYIGANLETVSRTFSKFQKDGLLRVRHKSIRILDGAGLEGVAGR
ncbi:MAG: helix-turn-helix domain-containing protein [Burkholderiales bacterium]|nr:helix-turn-helix domain-containing protein [Burkholderiales bacterium]